MTVPMYTASTVAGSIAVRERRPTRADRARSTPSSWSYAVLESMKGVRTPSTSTAAPRRAAIALVLGARTTATRVKNAPAKGSSAGGQHARGRRVREVQTVKTPLEDAFRERQNISELIDLQDCEICGAKWAVRPGDPCPCSLGEPPCLSSPLRRQPERQGTRRGCRAAAVGGRRAACPRSRPRPGARPPRRGHGRQHGSGRGRRGSGAGAEDRA
jgi:hypothetical protein